MAELVAHAFPDAAENWGLAALLATQHARAAARFSSAGELVPLRDQDRSHWDSELLERGRRHLQRAAVLRAPGPLQLQARIACVHGEAATFAEIHGRRHYLYDLLGRIDRSPLVRLNQAVALAEFMPERTALALANLERSPNRWPTITPTMPPGPSCCAGWIAQQRPKQPISPRSA